VFNFAAPGTPLAASINTSGHRFMLDILRQNTKSMLSWLIVGGIVVVFAINFGPGSLSKRGSFTGDSNPWAARVNGKTIGVTEWERQYRQMYSVLRQQAGDALTPELMAQLGLPAQALEQVIERELVIQEARRRGLQIGKEELTQAVHAMPAFQENGAFSFPLYEESARQAYGSAGKFEAALKDDLLQQKMVAAVRNTVKVSDAEVRAAWEAEADKVSLQFVRVPLAAVEATVKPTADEVKAFAAKQDAKIAAFYKDNAARFDQKRKVRVRHLLAKVAPGGDDAAARKRIDDAKARLAKGEDFGKVAAALSEDAATQARGGEVGFVSEGLFDDAFAKAALALEKGQVSEPVRSQSGWHLIQAEEIVPAKSVPLDQARETIARELLVKERAASIANEKLQAALAAAKGGKLAPVKIGSETFSPDDSGPIARASPVAAKLGAAEGLLADAFAAKAGQALPRIYDTPSGPMIAAVKTRETADPKAYDAQRRAVEDRLRNRKESAVQQAWIRELRSGAKVETNPDLLAAAGRGRGGADE
jgi:peptidyl-prolyl cis-trans isomerase D